MEYKLADFSPGLLYGGLAFFLIVLGRRLFRLVRRRKVDSRTFADTRATGFFVTLITAGAVAIIAHHMFFRFHALNIEFSRLELVYYWPRPKQIVNRPDFQRVEIVPIRRGAQLSIYVRNRPLKSVAFPSSPLTTQRILNDLNTWKLPATTPGP